MTKPRVARADDVVLLYGGLDWLEASTHKMLCTEVLEQLAEAHAQARAEYKPQKVELALTPDGEGEIIRPVFWISQGGIRGKFDYVIRTDELEIATRARAHHLEGMPNTMVRLRNEYLHRHGWEEAWARAERILACMLARDEHPANWKISRADVFVDLQGVNFDRITSPKQWFGPRGLEMRNFYKSGGKISGWGLNDGLGNADYWTLAMNDKARKQHIKKLEKAIESQGTQGGKSAVVFRMYDKCAEIARVSNKWFMFHIWGQMPGWRGAGVTDDGTPIAAQPVIRVEYQLRREVLKEFAAEDLPNGITTTDDMARGFERLWAYLSGHPGQKLNKYNVLRTVPGWITLREVKLWRTGHERERKEWPIHPWWQTIMNWNGETTPLTRQPTAKLRAAAEMFPHTAGWVSSLAARLVAWKGGDPRNAVDVVMESIDWENDLSAKVAELLVRKDALDSDKPIYDAPRQIAERRRTIEQMLASGMVKIDRVAVQAILEAVMDAEFAKSAADRKADRITSSMLGHLPPETDARAHLRLVKDESGDAGPPDGGVA